MQLWNNVGFVFLIRYAKSHCIFEGLRLMYRQVEYAYKYLSLTIKPNATFNLTRL